LSTKLVILGLLKHRPLHGYEIKHIIEESMGDWTNIQFGSIYFALNKLKKDGFLKIAGKEKQGGRPSRLIYEITENGMLEFKKQLETLWGEYDRQYFSLDIALFFLNELPRDKAVSGIEKRMAFTRKALEHIAGHEETELKRPEVPAVAQAIFSHTRIHMEAELRWLEELKERLLNGEY